MREDLQDQLYKKYPKLFAQKDLDKTKTAMCWGIAIGNGWFKLMDDMCNEVQTYCDNNNIQIEFVQVKQKFGGLRAYFFSGNEILQNIVLKHEKKSSYICECCGCNEKTKATNGRYIEILCPDCMKVVEDGYYWNMKDKKEKNRIEKEIENRRLQNSL